MKSRLIQVPGSLWLLHDTLPKTNIFAPKNGGFQLESPGFQWSPIFRGKFAVSFREGNPLLYEPGSKLPILGMVIQPLIGNP